MHRLVLCSVAALFGLSPLCRAEDVWELQADDTSSTMNMLRPGLPQYRHDLEGTAAAPDDDWMVVQTKESHSYEARVTGGYWYPYGCSPCTRFDLVDDSGTVVTPGVVTNDDTRNNSAQGVTVRWIGQQPSQYLRAVASGAALPGAGYTVEFFDTTLFVPRWNNSATQATVFILQNTTNIPVSGFVYFHDPAGTLLFAVAINVVEHGVGVFNTGSVPALAGKSGSAMIAQLGGYGALTGKAVAVEPATGFTFDTPITPVPR